MVGNNIAFATGLRIWSKVVGPLLFKPFAIWSQIACEQALCLGKGWKNHEAAAISPSCLCLVIADHLLARLLSVTSIHWNAINFVCKKGVGRQHATFTSCQKYCLFRWVFSLAGRLCPGGLSFDWKNVIFAAYFKLRGRDTHTDFFFFLILFTGSPPFPRDFFILSPNREPVHGLGPRWWRLSLPWVKGDTTLCFASKGIKGKVVVK